MNAREVFAGRAVWGSFLVLVGPLALGVLDTRLMTPLALPSYLAFTLGSAIGSRLLPTLELWVFWGPFLVGSYVVSVVLAAAYRLFRETFVAFKY